MRIFQCFAAKTGGVGWISQIWGDWTSHVDHWYGNIAGNPKLPYFMMKKKPWVALRWRFSRAFHHFSPRKILLLDGDLLVKRRLRPLLRLEPVSAGKDKVGGAMGGRGSVPFHDHIMLYMGIEWGNNGKMVIGIWGYNEILIYCNQPNMITRCWCVCGG